MQSRLRLEAKEEDERHSAALSLTALVRRRERGRDGGFAVVSALKELLDDLECAWRVQEEARGERRRERERERERLRRVHQNGEWDDESSVASSLNTLQRAEQRSQAGERQSEPSITMYLNGNYKPPRLPLQSLSNDDDADSDSADDGGNAKKKKKKFEAKLRGLCGRVWGLTSHHSNPELSARNLVDKVLLCLDKQVEAPPSPGVASYGGDLDGLRSRAVAASSFASAPERAA